MTSPTEIHPQVSEQIVIAPPQPEVVQPAVIPSEGLSQDAIDALQTRLNNAGDDLTQSRVARTEPAPVEKVPGAGMNALADRLINMVGSKKTDDKGEVADSLLDKAGARAADKVGELFDKTAEQASTAVNSVKNMPEARHRKPQSAGSGMVRAQDKLINALTPKPAEVSNDNQTKESLTKRVAAKVAGVFGATYFKPTKEQVTAPAPAPAVTTETTASNNNAPTSSWDRKAQIAQSKDAVAARGGAARAFDTIKDAAAVVSLNSVREQRPNQDDQTRTNRRRAAIAAGIVAATAATSFIQGGETTSSDTNEANLASARAAVSQSVASEHEPVSRINLTTVQTPAAPNRATTPTDIPNLVALSAENPTISHVAVDNLQELGRQMNADAINAETQRLQTLNGITGEKATQLPVGFQVRV